MTEQESYQRECEGCGTVTVATPDYDGPALCWICRGTEEPATAPAPLRAQAWGCWSCGEVFDSSTIRRLYRAAFEAWVQGSGLEISEHISCPECEAPGAMVRVSVSMAPGVSEWTAGHPWRVPA